MVMMGATAAAVFILGAFSPFTELIDDIKLPLLCGFGPLALLGTLAVLMFPGAAGLGGGLASMRHVRVPVVALGVLWGVLLASSLMSPHAWVAWHVAMPLWGATGLLLALALLPRERAELHLIVGVFLGFAAVQLLAATFHYAGGVEWLLGALYPKPPAGPDRLHQILITFSRTREFFGTILNVDFHAAYMLTVVPLAVGAMGAWQRPEARLMAWLVVVAGLTAVALSGSRDTLLGVAGGLVVAVVMVVVAHRQQAVRLGRWASRGVPAVALGLALLAGLAVAWRVIRRFSLGTSLSSRLIMWHGALGMWLAAPLLGTGPGTFRILFADFRTPDYHLHQISNVTLYAHNLYLDLLSEAGLLGLVAFLAFLGSALVLVAGAYLRLARAGDALQHVALGLLAGMVALSIQNFFSPVARWPVGLTFMAVQLGMALALVRLARTPADAAPRRPVAVPFVLPVAARLAVLGVAAVLTLVPMAHGWRVWQGALAHTRGVEAQALGNFDAAIVNYRRALDINPRSATTHYKLAHTLHTRATRARLQGAALQREIEAALQVYRRLEDFWPRYAEVSYNIALLERRAYGDALMDAVEAQTALEPQAAQALEQRIRAGLNAARAYRLQTFRHQASLVLGQSLYDLALFLRLVPGAAREGETPEALLREALAHLSEAEESWDAQVAGGLDAPDVNRTIRLLEARLDVLIQLDDFGAAAELAERIYLMKPHDTDHAQRLLDLHRLGRRDVEAALRAARQHVADDPLNVTRRLNLMAAAVAAGQARSALDEAALLERLLLAMRTLDPAFDPTRAIEQLTSLRRRAFIEAAREAQAVTTPGAGAAAP